MQEFNDSCKVIGSVWNKRQGWTCPPFPDVPKKTMALSIYSKITGWNAWEIEDKLIELGFQPSYRYLGLNNPVPKDPTTCVFFLRKYLEGDPLMNAHIGQILTGGIPASGLLVISHKVYCAIMQQKTE